MPGTAPEARTVPSSCATWPSRSGRSSRCARAASRVAPGSIHALVGENGAGKSTLVKIVAGVHRRDSGDFRLARRGRRLRLDRRVQGRRHRGDLPGADALPRPLGHREHLHGPPARRPRPAASTAARCTPRPSGSSSASASRIDPRRPARGLSIADQQIIEIAKAISLDASVLSWTSRPPRSQRRRGRPALRRRPQPARRGPRPGLHLAPLRRGLRPLRHRHRDARRRLRLHRRRSPTPPSTRSSRRMVGREVADLFPKTAGRDRRRRARGRGPHLGRRLPRRLLHRPRRRDRRPGRPRRRRPQRDRPRRLRRRRATTPARCALGGTRGPASAARAPRSGPAWRSSPRTAASRAWSLESSVARNVAARHPPPADARRPPHQRATRTAPPALGRPPRGQDQRARHDRRARMSGGNQQKVVLAKWLATEPDAADHRRAHPRHRRRHQGRGAPAAVRPRRRGPGDPDDLLRAARGARHGRPRPRRLRGPDHRRALPRGRHPRGRHARRHRHAISPRRTDHRRSTA